MKNKIDTQIIELNSENDIDDIDKIRQAADILKNGGIVAFPTETVYGLGANALEETAVQKIYSVKGRPSDNPLIVHLANTCEIDKYAAVTDIARRIIDFFMPAPLTVVLKKKSVISGMITGGRDTVAIRIPQNRVARKLIEFAGVPIAAPSANISGKPSPTSAKHILSELNGKIDAILCGDDCEIGLESTVIAFDDNEKVRILRCGAITEEILKDVVGEENIAHSVAEPNSNDSKDSKECETPQSPGMKYTHYSPDAPLYILIGEDDLTIDFIKEKAYKSVEKIGFLCYNEIFDKLNQDLYIDNGVIKNKDYENLKAISLGSKSNLNEQAKNLFYALNTFNEIGVDIIYTPKPLRIGIGEAIYNRLEKASGGKFIFL